MGTPPSNSRTPRPLTDYQQGFVILAAFPRKGGHTHRVVGWWPTKSEAHDYLVRERKEGRTRARAAYKILPLTLINEKRPR